MEVGVPQPPMTHPASCTFPVVVLTAATGRAKKLLGEKLSFFFATKNHWVFFAHLKHTLGAKPRSDTLQVLPLNHMPPHPRVQYWLVTPFEHYGYSIHYHFMKTMIRKNI